MLACFYGFATLLVVILTVVVWMAGKSSSKHIPFELPSEPGIWKARLLMLGILAGYIFCFLMSLGVFKNNNKVEPIITVPYHEPGQTDYYRLH